MESKTYGYARVSTQQQSLDRQVRNIVKIYPNAKIYREAYTGTKVDRPELTKLLKRVKKGDVIVFDSVSRMSRNAEDGIRLYFDLMNKGIDLVFIKEPHIDTKQLKKQLDNQISIQIQTTGNSATDVFIQTITKALKKFQEDIAKDSIKLAFAQSQKEVDDLHERTREGIQTARLNGKQIGRPEGTGKVIETNKEKRMKPLIRELSKTFNGSLKDKEVIAHLGISPNTYYKYKKELKESEEVH